MNEQAAEAVAKALRGRTWQSGGDIWLVLLDCADGRLAARGETPIFVTRHKRGLNAVAILN
jgi:hypothetical protein